MKSVYIHIPFCVSICNYCDFCKLYYDKKIINDYFDALRKEIEQTYKGEEIKTIYIGGGTPTALSLDELTILFDMLKIFKTENLVEFTIEGNVESIDKEKLMLFKKVGINRLSIGVQSFNPKILGILGRNHTIEMVNNVLRWSRDIGIDNINIDMMYGINGQTLDDLRDDLNILLNLKVPHISYYSLIIEPHTKLYIDSYPDIDEDLNATMYTYINKTLSDMNYNHYEISNYAKDGFESIHNLVYWHNLEYYGFGLGASSFIGNIRYDNTRSLNQYLNSNYILYEHILNDREMMENEMILGLRLTSGVNKNHFYEKYKKRIEDVFLLDKLIANEHLIDKDNFLYIPQDHLFISNSILIEF